MVGMNYYRDRPENRLRWISKKKLIPKVHVDQYEWLNKAGRIWFAEAEKTGLQFAPKSYEIAVTPTEFFGK